MNHIFSSFGTNRILFGSDWPVCLLATDYKKVITLINNYLDTYSAKIKAKVLGVNAIKIYNL
jgi:L-fuconolactonase